MQYSFSTRSSGKKKKKHKKWNLKVRPRVRGLDSSLPYAVAVTEARASRPPRQHPAQGREKAEGRRGRVPLSRRQKSAASGGRRGSPRLAVLRRAAHSVPEPPTSPPREPQLPGPLTA